MTSTAADDAASVVFTDVAESLFDVESLYDGSSADGGSAENGTDDASQAESAGSVTATQAAKALEAATEQSYDSGDEQDQPNPGDSIDAPTVLDAGPAPPDYAAATADRTRSQPAIRDEAAPPEPQPPPAALTHDIEAQLPVRREEEHGRESYSEGQRGEERQHGQDNAGTNDHGSAYRKFSDFVQPAMQTAQKYVEPPVVKVITVITPPARAVWERVEPQVRKFNVAIEPAVRGVRNHLGPPATKVGQALHPVILTGERYIERRLKSVALAMEPPLRTTWTRVEPVYRRTASLMEPVGAAALVILGKVYHLMVNKRTIAFVRRHWLHIFLTNIAFTFALLSLITLVKRPGYRRVEVYPEYYQTHPRRSYPSRFHQYTWQCPWRHYSDFSYTQWEHSGNFTLEEALDPGIILPANVSLTGRIDIKPAPLKQNSPVEIWMSTATTWGLIAERTKITSEGDTIVVPSPRVIEEDMSGRGSWLTPRNKCVSVFIGIYVNDRLPNFNVSSRNFEIRVGEWDSSGSWELEVRDSLTLSAGGEIRTDVFLDGRKIIVHSKSGEIWGKFRLRDHIQISSGHGLMATIEQEPPKRDPQGVVIPSELETTAIQGDTWLTVMSKEKNSHDPYRWPSNESTSESYLGRGGMGHDLESLYPMNSRHKSLSGDVTLQYGTPRRSSWHGSIDGVITDGSINFNGLHEGDLRFPSSNLTKIGDVSYFKTGEPSSVSNMAFNITSGKLEFYSRWPPLLY